MGDKGAAVILGNGGDGKSTLCAQLVQRGYSLLGDDKCVVRFHDNGICALPSIPYIKLNKPSIKELGLSHRDTTAICAAHSKVYVNLDAEFESEEAPLLAGVVLGKADQVSLSQLTQIHAFDTFIQHSYRKQKLIGAGLHKTHFAQCQQMAKSLKMYQYLRPLSGKYLSKPSPVFLDCIEELIGSGK